MDELTQSAVNHFLDRLEKEIKSRKDYAAVQLGTGSLVDFKFSLEVFIKNERKKVYVDIREIKENQTNLQHILQNVLDQIKDLMHA